MIKFFRKIRQNLLLENKTSKYFKYAIGEIVLVVIGILIALQINNWNEERKTYDFELALLHSFKSGLEKDILDIQGNVFYHQRGLSAIDSVIFHLENDAVYSIDSISSKMADAMMVTYFRYSTSAFETLKSNGVTTITNQSLRDKIIGVYDSQYNFFLQYQDSYNTEVERGLKEVFSSRFKESFKYDLKKDGFPGELRPLNFEALKTDQEFLYYLKSLKNRMIILIEWQYGQLTKRVAALINEVNLEISMKTNHD